MKQLVRFFVWVAVFMTAVPASAQQQDSVVDTSKKTTQSSFVGSMLARGTTETILLPKPELGLEQEKKLQEEKKSRFSDVGFYSSEEVIWGSTILAGWGTKDHWALGPGLQVTEDILREISNFPGINNLLEGKEITLGGLQITPESFKGFRSKRSLTLDLGVGSIVLYFGDSNLRPGPYFLQPGNLISFLTSDREGKAELILSKVLEDRRQKGGEKNLGIHLGLDPLRIFSPKFTDLRRGENFRLQIKTRIFIGLGYDGSHGYSLIDISGAKDAVENAVKNLIPSHPPFEDQVAEEIAFQLLPVEFIPHHFLPNKEWGSEIILDLDWKASLKIFGKNIPLIFSSKILAGYQQFSSFGKGVPGYKQLYFGPGFSFKISPTNCW